MAQTARVQRTHLKEHMSLQPGARVPSAIEVAISHKLGKPVNKGKVQKISPDEPIDAVLWTIAASFENANPKDVMKLAEAWLPTLLSCPFVWRYCDSDDAKYYHCLQNRESRDIEARAMT